MPLIVRPTKADHAIADVVARNTSEPAESFSQALTWAADEHVLCAVAAGWWLFCRFQAPQQQQISNHLLLTAVTTAIVPHLLKKHINQRRPDRVTIRAHLHGVPISGKARDAFPSGHAIHMGALASAACRLPTAQRNTIWALSGGLVLTRVILLAHWARMSLPVLRLALFLSAL